MIANLRGLLGGGVILSLCNGLVVVVATLVLSPAERGLMVVAATIPAIAALIATCGIGPAVREARPKTATSSLPALNQSHAALTLVTGVIGAVGSAAACFLGSWGLAGLGKAELIMAVALTGAAFVVTAQMTEAWYSGGRFRAGSLWAGGVAAAGLAAVLVSRPDSAEGFLAAQAIGMSAVLVVQWRVLVRAALLDTPRVHRSLLAELLRRGLPALGFTVGSAFVLRADRLVLGLVAPSEVVAVYALAATVSEVSRLVPIAIGQLALHRAAHDAPQHEMARLIRLGCVAAIGAGLVVIPLSFVLLPRVFGPAYADSPGLVVILSGAEIFFSAFLIANLALLGRGRQRTAGAIGAVGALACIPAYLLGASLWSAAGCAVASGMIYLVLYVVAQRRLMTPAAVAP